MAAKSSISTSTEMLLGSYLPRCFKLDVFLGQANCFEVGDDFVAVFVRQLIGARWAIVHFRNHDNVGLVCGDGNGADGGDGQATFSRESSGEPATG